MNVTAAQNSYNLGTARRNVAAQLDVDPANLEYAERVLFNKALAGYILQHPLGFSEQTLATAAGIAGRSYDDLADTSFNWGDFGAETVANVPDVLGGFTNKLFVVLTVAAVAYVALNRRSPALA